MSLRKIFLSVLVGTSLVITAWGQSGGKPSGGGGNTGSTGGSTSTTTRPLPPRTSIPNTFPDSGEIPRPIYLTGKVVSSQGQPLSEPVPIQRVCGTTARREGYTDTHGNFSIMIGDGSTNAFQDASETGVIGRRQSVTPRQLWGCEIRAMMPGYSSTVIQLAGRDFSDSSSIGTIVLQKLGVTEGDSISVISLKAPDKARREYERGLDSYQKRKFSDAEKHFAKAVEEYPQYASAWDARGKNQLAEQHVEEASKSFQAAIAADQKYVPPYVRLAMLEAGKSNWNEALRLSSRAIELDPLSYADAYFLKGASQFNLHNLPEAERSGLKAAEIDKEHRFPRIELLLGTIYRAKGDNTAAVQHFKSYVQLDPTSADLPAIQDFIAKTDGQNASAAGAPVPKP